MTRNKARGRSQQSDWGVMEMVKERPLAATAAAAGAAAAGLFLWSKRTRISDQLSNLSDQFGEWKDHFGSEIDDAAGLKTPNPKVRRSRARSQPTT